MSTPFTGNTAESVTTPGQRYLGILTVHRHPRRQHDKNGVDVTSLSGQVQRRLPVNIAVKAVRPGLQRKAAETVQREAQPQKKKEPIASP